MFLINEDHKLIVFPPQMTEIAKRPDITIYSAVTEDVIFIELTVPTKESLSNAYARKKDKYEDLIADNYECRGWSLNCFPV